MLVVLLALLVICFFIFRKELAAPAFLFTFGFAVQAVWAVLYQKAWGLGLHTNTFLVIVLGVAEFIAVCYITNLILEKNYSKKKSRERTTAKKVSYIKVNKILTWLCLIFTIVSSVIYLYFAVKCGGGDFSSLDGIANGISGYNVMAKFTDSVIPMPSIVSNMNIVAAAIGFWFIYIIVNNFVAAKKINALQTITAILCILSSMLSGSRTVAATMVLSALVAYLILVLKNNGKYRITKKSAGVAIIAVVTAMIVFYGTAVVMGRDDVNDIPSYLSVYLGAEVKNLDMYLKKHPFGENNAGQMWGAQTFHNIYIAPVVMRLNGNIKMYQQDQPFRKYHGLKLGNVHTTFYQYIYDFGYIGEAILVAIMAIISQIIYFLAKRSSNSKHPPMPFLIYFMVSNSLILSFFSEKFYGTIISTLFIKYVVIWLLMNYACRQKISSINSHPKKQNYGPDIKCVDTL